MDDELERIRREKLRKMIEKSKRSDEMETEIEVNDNDFEEKVIRQSKEVPVVVDFWAPWCMPCLVLGPVMEKLAREYNGKFVLAKANLNDARSTAQKYGIMSIPNVKLFRDGEVADGFVGALGESAVKEWLGKNIK